MDDMTLGATALTGLADTYKKNRRAQLGTGAGLEDQGMLPAGAPSVAAQEAVDRDEQMDERYRKSPLPHMPMVRDTGDPWSGQVWRQEAREAQKAMKGAQVLPEGMSPEEFNLAQEFLQARRKHNLAVLRGAVGAAATALSTRGEDLTGFDKYGPQYDTMSQREKLEAKAPYLEQLAEAEQFTAESANEAYQKAADRFLDWEKSVLDYDLGLTAERTKAGTVAAKEVGDLVRQQLTLLDQQQQRILTGDERVVKGEVTAFQSDEPFLRQQAEATVEANLARERAEAEASGKEYVPPGREELALMKKMHADAVVREELGRRAQALLEAAATADIDINRDGIADAGAVDAGTALSTLTALLAEAGMSREEALADPNMRTRINALEQMRSAQLGAVQQRADEELQRGKKAAWAAFAGPNGANLDPNAQAQLGQVVMAPPGGMGPRGIPTGAPGMAPVEGGAVMGMAAPTTGGGMAAGGGMPPGGGLPPGGGAAGGFATGGGLPSAGGYSGMTAQETGQASVLGLPYFGMPDTTSRTLAAIDIIEKYPEHPPVYLLRKQLEGVAVEHAKQKIAATGQPVDNLAIDPAVALRQYLQDFKAKVAEARSATERSLSAASVAERQRQQYAPQAKTPPRGVQGS